MPRRPTQSFHSADYRRFRAKLRAARLAAGMNQTEAGQALGRPQSFIAKCENGERRVDAVELAHFARLYRKPLSFFVSVR